MKEVGRLLILFGCTFLVFFVVILFLAYTSVKYVVSH